MPRVSPSRVRQKKIISAAQPSRSIITVIIAFYYNYYRLLRKAEGRTLVGYRLVFTHR